MGAMVDEKPLACCKDFPKPTLERRPSKVSKKTREKKSLKGLQVEAVVEAIEDNSTESDCILDNKEKKGQGIVIDGKTYTCATCKAGHRVGVCKHGRQRPMTATHPPGRPPAGAPKKIVCDCPKQCSCKKRDCKCARQCSCTQNMYMLVYIPAPGELQASEDENGTWRLGEKVITDLKGNVLTPEQIKERQQLKEAQKSQPRDGRVSGVNLGTVITTRISTSPNAETKPDVSDGCCTHKNNISSGQIAAEASPQSGRLLNSAVGGCNCGHRCSCAFCPEHPDNSTSRSLAQEAMHYAGNFYPQDLNSIMPFMPTGPSAASCMGGAPQFAISHSNHMPSQFDLQQAFPNRGYVIGYPFQYRRNNSTGFPVSPFNFQQQFHPNVGLIHDTSLHGLQTPMTTPQPDILSMNFPLATPDIGNAIVASAGTRDWNSEYLLPTDWSLEHPTTDPIFGDFLPTPSLSGPSIDYSRSSITSLPNEGLGLGNDLVPHDEDFFRDLTTTTIDEIQASKTHITSRKSCCDASKTSTPFLKDYGLAGSEILSTEESYDTDLLSHG